MNRIEERFARLQREQQKGFIAYIGAGDPNLEATRQLALALDIAGVDILELGVPFSDPLADGLVNQLAAQRGLESGTTPPKVLETVAAIRRDEADDFYAEVIPSVISPEEPPPTAEINPRVHGLEPVT
jgi:tryptophan synthase alpha chain